MQFSLYTNQAKAIEWGISLNQATLFGFIYNAATWANKVGDYWNVSKGKILEEMPILTDKIDTIYRMEKVLIDKGLLKKKLIDGKDYFKVTEKGLGWNQTEHVNPIGKKSEPRKKIRPSSEKNPNSLGKKSDVSYNQTSYNQDQIKKTSAQGAANTPDDPVTDPMIKLKPQKIPDDFWQSFSEGVDVDHMRDWLAVRKLKKATNSITAFNAIAREAAKARLTTAQVIQICAENSWAGFKASFNIDKGATHAKNQSTNQQPQRSKQTVAAQSREYLQREAERLSGACSDRFADDKSEITVV